MPSFIATYFSYSLEFACYTHTCPPADINHTLNNYTSVTEHLFLNLVLTMDDMEGEVEPVENSEYDYYPRKRPKRRREPKLQIPVASPVCEGKLMHIPRLTNTSHCRNHQN